jgi:hypothetical protein
LIHYHGTPMTPTLAASRFFVARHAMVSFARAQGRDQLPLFAEVCQSFALDNGAFTAWKSGEAIIDWTDFYAWIDVWRRHPGFDWALIPDVIDGDEPANDALVEAWPFAVTTGVPVWHMHESTDRFLRLCERWPRVAIGSSGAFAEIGTNRWWRCISEALDAICDEDGFPSTKLHGLRMLDPTIFSQIPFSSADSTNVARNMGLDVRWTGPYVPRTPEVRAFVLGDRIESHASARSWSRGRGVQQNLELLG